MDPEHIAHERVHAWLDEQGGASRPEWSSCAITQDGFVRILSQPSYPHPASVPAAVDLLAVACDSATHEFWSCDMSLTDESINRPWLVGHRQITDVYLLALAVARGGRFVTLDRAVPPELVPGATDDQLVVL